MDQQFISDINNIGLMLLTVLLGISIVGLLVSLMRLLEYRVIVGTPGDRHTCYFSSYTEANRYRNRVKDRWPTKIRFGLTRK